MAKADIQLRGRSYSIACAPGQESRIEALSKQLDTRVKQIEGAVGDIGEERLLLITALALLDELDTAKRTGPGTAFSEARAAEALVKAASRITSLAERTETGK